MKWEIYIQSMTPTKRDPPPEGEDWEPFTGIAGAALNEQVIVWKRQDMSGEASVTPPSDLQQAHATIMACRKRISELDREVGQWKTRHASSEKTSADRLRMIGEMQRRLEAHGSIQ